MATIGRLAFVVALLAAAGAAQAQQDSTRVELDSALLRAVRLVTEGQGDSARALVRTRLARTRPADSTYAEVLYAAGVVAATLDSARFYLRRVSIEYPRSPWAERALLRLTQQSYGAGDLEATRRAAQRIIADYPFGTTVPEANFWAGRAQLDLGNLAEACRYLDDAMAGAVEDVELQNRIAYHRQRCTALQETPVPDRPQPPAATGRVVYAVQLAAVQTPQAADELMRRVAGQGFDPHVFRDADGLFKVRVGRFADRAEAQVMLARLQRTFGGSPFVVEER
ncbi:MAG TPA: SPOR domain-containing protein [Gemmatimonadales bacterium]|jgi:hypothetical protein